MDYKKSYKSGGYRYSQEQMDKQKGASRQLSLKWTCKWLLSKIPFLGIAPPKTLRAENYREVFMKKNPGIIIPGLYICAYCFKPITSSDMQVDHIVPVNKGGLNWTPNFVPACVPCNGRKKDKIWGYKRTGFIIKTVTFTVRLLMKVVTLGRYPKKVEPLKDIKVNWVWLGRIGKVVYTILQTLSNLLQDIFKLVMHLLTDIVAHPNGIRGLTSKIFWAGIAIGGLYFGLIT